jgi:hypothetical protein
MGGGSLNSGQIGALGGWLDTLPAPAVPTRLDTSAVDRGHAVFERLSCNSCHAGAHFTDNTARDVGTGGVFQVPSLLGVGTRAPLMHDGCASSLMARLTDVRCGGSNHGATASLPQNELSDLVWFLQSL